MPQRHGRVTAVLMSSGSRKRATPRTRLPATPGYRHAVRRITPVLSLHYSGRHAVAVAPGMVDIILVRSRLPVGVPRFATGCTSQNPSSSLRIAPLRSDNTTTMY